MSFHEWLKEKHGQTWEGIFCKISELEILKYTIDYEIYCMANNLEPKWS